MSLAVELKNVSKWFFKSNLPLFDWKKKKKIEALAQVDLKIPRGSIFVLVGPNGSGKTTLLKILAGLLLPDGGEVWIHGSPLKGNNLCLQNQVALASASGRDFYGRLTVRQNLEFFAALYSIPPQVIRQEVLRTAHCLGLEKFLNRPYEQLSSGTRQKLILARTFLSQASILLLDEPTRSLDPLAARDFRNFLKELSKKFGKTLLLATHSLAEAEEWADFIGILHEGRLVRVGRAQTFNPKNETGGLAVVFEALCRKAEENLS